MSRREARKERRALKKMVREDIVEYLEDNPEADIATARAAIREDYEELFGDKPFLNLLFKFLEQLLPALLKLLLGVLA